MGLTLRQSTIVNGTNTITIKGSALSYIEGDSNFMYLLTNMSGSTISITGSNVGILSTNTTINGTVKTPNLTNSNNNNLLTYNSSTGQLYYYNTASINVGTASYVNPLVQNVSLTGSLNVSGSGDYTNNLTVTGSITSNTGILVKHYPGGFTHATEDYDPGSTGTILYTSVGAQTGNTYVEIAVRQNGGASSAGVLALNANGGGSVAIGKTTATSLSALDVKGNTVISGSLNISGSTSTTGSVGINTTASSAWNLDVTNRGGAGTPSNFRVGDSGFNDVFTVSVGSTSQGYSDMYLKGQSYPVALYSNPQAGVGYTVNSIQYSTASAGLIAGGISAPLVLGTQGTEKVRIHLTGDVSIGTQQNNINESGFKLNITGSGVSGSLNVNKVLQVSGSNTIITGSLLISGSQTFIGNHILTGSIEVSGSSTFRNSIFTVTGSSNFSGSMNIQGDLNVVSGSGFYRWGNKLFNYAQFANTGSISVTQNVSGAFAYTTTYFGDGVSVTNGSRITFANSGLYNIQFSALANQGVGAPNLHVWFKKTGSNIDNSDTLVTLTNNSQTLLSWNFAYPFSASEYVEIFYHSNTANTSFPANAAGSGFPLAPSIITTVTQIA